MRCETYYHVQASAESVILVPGLVVGSGQGDKPLEAVFAFGQVQQNMIGDTLM